MAAIGERMEVVGSDGMLVGTVARVEGERFAVTPADGGDGQPHDLPLTMVDRVEDRVHLTVPAAGVAAPAGAIGATPSLAETASLPPVLNRQVEGAAPRRNFYLPWIVGIVGLLLLLLLFRGVVTDTPADRPATGAGVAAPG